MDETGVPGENQVTDKLYHIMLYISCDNLLLMFNTSIDCYGVQLPEYVKLVAITILDRIKGGTIHYREITL